MSLSAGQISAALLEIGDTLCGGSIRRIDQPQAWSILFEIERHGTRYWLYFSAHRQGLRCHLLSKRPPNPPKPPRFCQLLRARLRHKKLLSLTQIHEDRIIELCCAWPQDTDTKGLRFVAELTGFSANFFLLSAEGHILGTLYPLPSHRFAGTGKYTFPLQRPQKESGTAQPFPLREADRPFVLNRSIERHYHRKEQQKAEEDAQKALNARFEEARHRLKKQLKNLEVKRLEAKEGARFKTWGEALKCHLHEVRLKDASLTCPDPDPAAPPKKMLVIPLDPTRSASENMALFFKKYKKSLLAEASLRQIIDKKQLQLKEMEACWEKVLAGEICTDEIGQPFREPLKKRAARKKSERSPAVYLSADGIRLMLGRSAQENDALTFRTARGKDLWFHARGASGAHLVVRMEGRDEIPYQTLLDAATLAKHFSKADKETKAEILYTYKKYLQRPKNGKPGAVLCSQEKVLYIASDPERLERILQNRLA